MRATDRRCLRTRLALRDALAEEIAGVGAHRAPNIRVFGYLLMRWVGPSVISRFLEIPIYIILPLLIRFIMFIRLNLNYILQWDCRHLNRGTKSQHLYQNRPKGRFLLYRRANYGIMVWQRYILFTVMKTETQVIP